MIQARIDRVAALLSRVKQYNDIVMADTFQNTTIAEIKDNVKDILTEAKAEIDLIKGEVDNW